MFFLDLSNVCDKAIYWGIRPHSVDSACGDYNHLKFEVHCVLHGAQNHKPYPPGSWGLTYHRTKMTVIHQIGGGKTVYLCIPLSVCQFINLI